MQALSAFRFPPITSQVGSLKRRAEHVNFGVAIRWLQENEAASGYGFEIEQIESIKNGHRMEFCKIIPGNSDIQNVEFE